MNNCSNHKKDLFGETDMKKVAEMIGDLHYSASVELYAHLCDKYELDSIKDRENPDHPKVKLANILHLISIEFEIISALSTSAWQISKPFMTQSECAGCGRDVNHCVCP